MGSFLTGKILPSASPVQKILHPERRPGGPDLHRHHRPHQGDHQLRPRQGRPPGHLRRPVHRKRDPHVLPQPEKAPGGGLPVRLHRDGQGGQRPAADGRGGGRRHHAGGPPRPGHGPPAPPPGGPVPDRPGGQDRPPAVRAGGHHPPDPAGDRLLLRHLPVLCIGAPLM